MTMDGLTLYASMLEIRSLVGGRVDKIQQPERDELIVGVYAGGENRKLLLSASASHARAQLTGIKRASPIEAPAFCMLLRKRLTGGRIVSVDQPNLDRVLAITIEARNDLGDIVPYTLYVEVMGKHSNIILTGEDGAIVDAIRRVGIGMSIVRSIMPGVAYAPPPAQDKRIPLGAAKVDFHESLFGRGRIDKALSSAWFGLSPAMAGALVARVTDARELEALSGPERDLIAQSLFEFYSALARRQLSPTVELGEFGEPVAAYPFVPQGCQTKAFITMADALDACYEEGEGKDLMKRRGASLRRVITNNIERCEKKLALYDDALTSDEAIGHAKLMGELITANLHALKPGSGRAMVMNYYLDPPEPVEIELDPRFSAGDNAQRWYRKYQKMRLARDMAKTQRDETLSELSYLEGQLDNLDKCTSDAELNEIADELRQEGYLRREAGKPRQKAAKAAASKPMRFLSSDGISIYVGKNNRQNDLLTLHMAEGSDIFMHAKNIPGSHVIVKVEGREPPKTTLYEAAMLAAFYSRSRSGENVPVDYAERRYVKKPPGAKPGMVIYSSNRTAYITPDEAVIKGLKRLE